MSACCKLAVLVVIIGMIAGCTYPLKKTAVSTTADSESRLSPPPSAPGHYENKEVGFTVSFPESISLPKSLDLPDQVFHLATPTSVPICQIFVSEIPENELLEPAAAKIWMIDKMESAHFNEVEIIRAEMVSLNGEIIGLFLSGKFKWKDRFFWGAHVIVDYEGKRITVFGIDDGRLDRIESTVMSLTFIN